MAKRSGRSVLAGKMRSAYMQQRASEAPAAAPAEKRSYRIPVNVKKYGFWLDPDVMERARDAAVFLSGPPEHLTLSGLVTQALEHEIAALSKKHHGGKPFPKRSSELRPGARIKG